jgi:hypothetical protein
MSSGKRPPPICIPGGNDTSPLAVHTDPSVLPPHQTHKEENFSLLALLFDKARFRRTREALALMKEASSMFKDVKDRLDSDARVAFEVRLQQ